MHAVSAARSGTRDASKGRRSIVVAVAVVEKTGGLCAQSELYS